MLLVDELRAAWAEESREHRTALVLVTLIGFGLRAIHLGQPMRYDEAVTYMYFVRQPWRDALSLYTYPNNHLFHTALAKLSVVLLGPEPWALRLPAFVAGVLCIPATYAAMRALYDSRTGLFAAAVVAWSGTLTLYSTNARGYTIVVLAFLLLILVASRIVGDEKGASRWLSFAVIAALGLWTVPVMLFPLGTVALWLALTLLVAGRSTDLRQLARALGVAAGLALALYAPVIARQSVAAITRNRFVASTGWFDFFEQLPSSIGDALVSWSLGIPPLVSIGLAALAVLTLRHHSKVSRFPVGVPLAAFVWCCWLLVVTHRAPFARIWMWLYPLVAALAGAGIGLVVARRRRLGETLDRRLAQTVGVVTLIAAASVALSRAVFDSRDTGIYTDADRASIALQRMLQNGDHVIAPIPSNAPLSFYFDRHGVSQQYLSGDEATARRLFVIVNRREGQTLESVVPRSVVGSARQITGEVVARFPTSEIVMLTRADAATK